MLSELFRLALRLFSQDEAQCTTSLFDEAISGDEKQTSVSQALLDEDDEDDDLQEVFNSLMFFQWHLIRWYYSFIRESCCSPLSRYVYCADRNRQQRKRTSSGNLGVDKIRRIAGGRENYSWNVSILLLDVFASVFPGTVAVMLSRTMSGGFQRMNRDC